MELRDPDLEHVVPSWRHEDKRGEELICSGQSPIGSPAATLPSNQLPLLAGYSVPSAIQVRIERPDGRARNSTNENSTLCGQTEESSRPYLT